MFLLPFVMEYSGAGPSNYRTTQNNEETKTIQNLEISDYIYLFKENDLFKFKVELQGMDIVNVIEEHIKMQDQEVKEIMSLKDAEKTKIPVKFLYYLGKYKLKNNFFKTENYLVPEQTDFLKLLIKKYRNKIVTHRDLINLNDLVNVEIDKDHVLDLFLNAKIELIEKLSFNKEELDITINNIKALLSTNQASISVLNKLKFIISSAEDNQELIKKLGIEDKFYAEIICQKAKKK
ncbi:MAG: hypothetical protein IKL65_02600 [Bacilli bacterium]|nr:hypothetical protein [Bacilli bacterium]